MHFKTLILKILLKSVNISYNFISLKLFSDILLTKSVLTLHEHIAFSVVLL